MIDLTVEGLRCRRGGRPIGEVVSLHLSPGGSIAIVGPSGHGKSTLILTLAGVLPAESGSVRLGGEPVQPLNVGLVPQPVGLVRTLTALENVLVASYARGRGPAAARAMSAAALEAVGLSAQLHRPVEELSGGQRQRVAVARAIAPGQRLVLADEPTSELDAASRDLVVTLLLDVTRRDGMVILATNDPEVAALCDHTLDIGTPGMSGTSGQ